MENQQFFVPIDLEQFASYCVRSAVESQRYQNVSFASQQLWQSGFGYRDPLTAPSAIRGTQPLDYIVDVESNGSPECARCRWYRGGRRGGYAAVYMAFFCWPWVFLKQTTCGVLSMMEKRTYCCKRKICSKV